MADNQLAQAYSILGQATTAEYKRRRKEEDDYRKRAKRDQMLGYILAPIGQEFAKGVSDIISAPFEKPVEKLLQTEQGRALNSDIKAITRQKTNYDALGKKITTDYAGDSYAYHLEKVEKYIEEDTRREFLADLRISPKQLEGDTEAAIQFSRLLQSRLEKAGDIAREEDNQYLAGISALSNYKTGQDAKEVLAKTTPYSKGPLQGVFRGVKRLFTGSSPFSGPTDEEKKNAIAVARQGLNLTGMESEKLLALVNQGATVKRLEKEIDIMAEYKDPEFQAWWGKSKDQTNFVSDYHSGNLSRGMSNVVRKYYAKNKKYPDQEVALSMLAESLEGKGLQLTATAQQDLVNSVMTAESAVRQRDVFRENYLQGFSNADSYLQASSEDKKRVDAAWKRLSQAAVSQSQRNFASFYEGLSIEEADEYVNRVSGTAQAALIRQNAIAALNNLDYTGGEEKNRLFGLGPSYITDKKYTGALRDSGFSYNFVSAPSREDLRAIQPIVRNAVAGTSPAQADPVVAISEDQINRITAEPSLENRRDSLLALENAGISIPDSLKKELLGDDDADSESRSRVIPGSGLDTLIKLTDGRYRSQNPREDFERRAAKSAFLGGDPEPINVSSWFDALQSSVSSDRAKYRNIFTGEDTRTGLPFEEARKVTASSSLEPIPLEQTSELLETPTVADKQQGLLDDIRRGRDFEPKSKRKPSLLSNRSSLAIQTQERVNSFDVPSLNTKEGRGVVAKFKSEVKEQLGVTLSKADTRKIVTGLVDPTDEQIQTILKVLEENAPQKRLVDPDEKTIEKLLDILGSFAPIGMEPTDKKNSIDEEVDEIVSSIKNLKGNVVSSLSPEQVYEMLGPRKVPYDERIDGQTIQKLYEREGYSDEIRDLVIKKLYGV